MAWLHSHRASGLSAHSGSDSQTVFRCPLRCLWLRTLPVLRPLKAFRFTRFVVESCHLLDDAGRRDHFFDRLLHLCLVYLSVIDFFPIVYFKTSLMCVKVQCLTLFTVLFTHKLTTKMWTTWFKSLYKANSTIRLFSPCINTCETFCRSGFSCHGQLIGGDGPSMLEQQNLAE